MEGFDEKLCPCPEKMAAFDGVRNSTGRLGS
jgi:hypothetical protein